MITPVNICFSFVSAPWQNSPYFCPINGGFTFRTIRRLTNEVSNCFDVSMQRCQNKCASNNGANKNNQMRPEAENVMNDKISYRFLHCLRKYDFSGHWKLIPGSVLNIKLNILQQKSWQSELKDRQIRIPKRLASANGAIYFGPSATKTVRGPWADGGITTKCELMRVKATAAGKNWKEK